MEQYPDEVLAHKERANRIKLETFDRFVDLALDGEIEMSEALKSFINLYIEVQNEDQERTNTRM